MSDCLFCSIAAGELPCAKLYEDELVFAFLDIAPINPGHALVIPKEHAGGAAAIPEETSGRMFHVAARLGVAMKRALEMDGFNLHLADGKCAGQVVGHAHLHVIPRSFDDGFHWNWRREDGGMELDAVAAEILEKFKA